MAYVVLAKPCRSQLRDRYDAMLSSGNFSHDDIGLGDLVAHIATKSPSVAGSPPTEP